MPATIPIAYAVMISHCRHGIYTRIFRQENITLIDSGGIHGHHTVSGEPMALANSSIGDWQHKGLSNRYCPDTVFGHVMAETSENLEKYLTEIYTGWAGLAASTQGAHIESPSFVAELVAGLLGQVANTERFNPSIRQGSPER